MHEDIATALRVLAAIGFLALVACLGWLAVRAAKRGGKGFRELGAALMLFGWGHMRDPRNDTVAEANEGSLRKDQTAGDPVTPKRLDQP
jgi:hypothetical protein